MAQEINNAVAAQISLMGLSNRVPSYDGKTESVHNFLNQLERISEMAGWNPATIMNMARISLKGEAQRFVDSHPILKNTNEWIVFRNALVNRFDPKPDISVLERQFSSCFQNRGETVESYVTRLRQLNERMVVGNQNSLELTNYIQQRLICQFKTGLLPEFQRDLWLSEPQTLEEAVKTAKRVEIVEQHVRGQSVNAIEIPSTDICSKLDQLVARFDKLTTALSNTNGSSQSQNRNQNSEMGNRKIFKCFRCNKPGHIARDCLRAIKCYTCGKGGHNFKDCKFSNNDHKPVGRLNPHAPAYSQNSRNNNTPEDLNSNQSVTPLSHST